MIPLPTVPFLARPTNLLPVVSLDLLLLCCCFKPLRGSHCLRMKSRLPGQGLWAFISQPARACVSKAIFCCCSYCGAHRGFPPNCCALSGTCIFAHYYFLSPECLSCHSSGKSHSNFKMQLDSNRPYKILSCFLSRASRCSHNTFSGKGLYA